jgi:hypothetical protein
LFAGGEGQRRQVHMLHDEIRETLLVR